LNNFKKTLLRYTVFISWLLTDSLWRNRWLTLSILVTGFLGVAFQVKVFALIIYYARHFSTGSPIVFAGYTLNPRESMGLLVFGSVAVSGLLCLSTLCVYFSRRGILRMGREYEEFCSKRVFFLLGMNVEIPFGEDETVRGDSYLLRLIKSDSRLAGRVLRILLSLIIPGLTLIVVVAFLLYLETGLTLIVSNLAVVFILYQYRVSRHAAGHSVRFEKMASSAALKYKELLQHYKMKVQADESSALVERVFTQGPVKHQLDAYDGRLMAVENSRLVSGMFMAVVIGAIILVMGGGIIGEGTGWGRLLVYVISLRFAMANLQTTFTSITAINRFYPQLRRYFSFLESVKLNDQEQFSPLDDNLLQIRMKGESAVLNGSYETITILNGTCLSLVTPLELNRYTMATLIRTILGESGSIHNSALYSMRFSTTKASCPHISVRDLLGRKMVTEDIWIDLKDWFPNESIWEEARDLLSENLDSQIETKTWDEVSPILKFCLGIISILMSDCRWVVLEARGLKLLGLEAARFYLERFKDRIVVVIFNGDFDRVGSFGESVVAVSGEKNLMGLGTPEWFASVKKNLEGLPEFDSGKMKAKAGIQETDDPDELDEM
jgi:hypothetical protein